MGTYYYYTKSDGELIDSTSQMKGEQFTRLNELQYAIARLAISGYSQKEVESATEYVFILVKDRIEG